MKIRKYLIVLVLVPLFLSVGYADDNVTAKSSVSSLDADDDWGSEVDFEELDNAKDKLKSAKDKLTSAEDEARNLDKLLAIQ